MVLCLTLSCMPIWWNFSWYLGSNCLYLLLSSWCEGLFYMWMKLQNHSLLVEINNHSYNFFSLPSGWSFPFKRNLNNFHHFTMLYSNMLCCLILLLHWNNFYTQIIWCYFQLACFYVVWHSVLKLNMFLCCFYFSDWDYSYWPDGSPLWASQDVGWGGCLVY